MSDFLQYFFIEAEELLATLQRYALLLDKHDSWQEAIKELKRAAHSFKGASRLVELYDIGDEAHSLEDFLVELGDKQSVPAQDEVSELLQYVDRLEEMVRAANSGPSPSTSGESSIVSQIKTAKEIVVNPTDGATGSVSVLEQAPAEGSVPSPTLESSQQEKDALSTPLKAHVNVSTEVLSEIGRCAGQMVELSSQSVDWRTQLEKTKKSIVRMLHVVKQREGQLENENRDYDPFLDGFSGVSFEDLKIFVDEVSPELESGLSTLSLVSRQLHRQSLASRLIPISEHLYRFERVVRTVSIEMDREVELDIEGQDVKVDREIFEQLLEPISHLLRNAIAHGIEPTDVRQAEGKASRGAIRLSFLRNADKVKIIVQDDGAGLDIKRIKKVALARNRSSRNVNHSDDELEGNAAQELIFQSGFSTQDNVSQVAGRGVGLDVVKDIARRLGGNVSVKSAPGIFTRFTIEVPANLDVMEVFVVVVADQEILLPLSQVKTTLLLSPDSFVSHLGEQAIIFDEEPVPIRSLQNILEFKERRKFSDLGGHLRVIVVNSNNGPLALTVDELHGGRRVVVRKPESSLGGDKLIGGTAVMGDGRPAFILDVEILSSIRNMRNIETSPMSLSLVETKESPQILIVDDSLTTRMLEKSILEAAGYKTRLAANAEQALTLLNQEEVDLMVVDCEMPDVDGLELTRTLRAQEDYKDLPVIMLTSLGSPEDMRRGIDAGVHAYLVKGRFSQSDFLERVSLLAGKPGGDK